MLAGGGDVACRAAGACVLSVVRWHLKQTLNPKPETLNPKPQSGAGVLSVVRWLLKQGANFGSLKL